MTHNPTVRSLPTCPGSEKDPDPFTSPPVFPGQEDDGSLDPTDWTRFRILAHQAIDRIIDLQEGIRQEPAWRPIPTGLEARFKSPIPQKGEGLEAAVREFEELVLPFPTGNIHPRFWGWAAGSGSPTGILAEALAAGLNPVTGIFNDSASRIEAQLIEWMKEAFSFPATATGIITSGGSMANLIGLAAARDDVGRIDLALNGIGELGARMVLYASTEVHSSVPKACQILGIGRKNLRLVPVDSNFRIRIDELEAAIAEDRYAGHLPFAIVGTAGTINTGAVDDLNGLAEVARRNRLWLHIDGAFGAMAALSPETESIVRGVEKADSIAFDFHKWMHVPYEGGCVLVRDGDAHRRPFTVTAPYLHQLPRGLASQDDSTNLKGPQLSRGFKALKVWLWLKEQGLDRIGQMIAKNVRQARTLANMIREATDFDLLAPTVLNVVAFRYSNGEIEPSACERLNREILLRLQEEGTAVLSSTSLNGTFALRACICNHRTSAEDLVLLIREARRIGQEIGLNAN